VVLDAEAAFCRRRIFCGLWCGGWSAGMSARARYAASRDGRAARGQDGGPVGDFAGVLPVVRGP